MAARLKVLEMAIRIISDPNARLDGQINQLCAAHRQELEARFFDHPELLQALRQHNFDLLEPGADERYTSLGQITRTLCEDLQN